LANCIKQNKEFIWDKFSRSTRKLKLYLRPWLSPMVILLFDLFIKISWKNNK
jgi:hypothetical protein